MARPRIAIVSRETVSNRHGKPWSEKEIAFLMANRERWSKVPWLARLLRRTPDAVKSKLKRQRLVIQPHRKPRHRSPGPVIPNRRRRADRELAA
jgi:hypothetical protein